MVHSYTNIYEVKLSKCDFVMRGKNEAILENDVDSGTASEIGYATALGKSSLGYRGDFRLAADNEGSLVNLQVEYFIHKNGGRIITEIADLREALQKVFA
ncbi:hypothetical protein GF376_01310 [Candidatus Peregrinibacteria bacterium]|nr:hypothetical protein [Candidatus Peregrinibacteria bacterium]